MRELKRVNVLEANSKLKRLSNSAYDLLIQASDLLYKVHESLEDEDKADNWYDLYSSVRDIARSITDQQRYL